MCIQDLTRTTKNSGLRQFATVYRERAAGAAAEIIGEGRRACLDDDLYHGLIIGHLRHAKARQRRRLVARLRALALLARRLHCAVVDSLARPLQRSLQHHTRGRGCCAPFPSSLLLTVLCQTGVCTHV